MAIVFEKEHHPVNWVAIFFVVFSAGFIAFAAYYLFFAASPRIEVVLPDPLEQARRISIEPIDPGAVLGGAAFRSLRVYAGPPSIGSLGRDNPFQPL